MRALLLAVLLLPSGASAAKKKDRFADLEASLKSPRQWKIVETAFGEILGGRLREIEAAEPNRFWKNSSTFALRGLNAENHFTRVDCIYPAPPCPERASDLEERLLNVTMLDALPFQDKSRLYDARTWELSEKGRTTLKEIRERFPDLEKRFAKIVVQRVGQPRD